ncbi:MerR family transcriptional regulator [Burkholderia pyrrocinia]|uniref:MerR family transcriptional regulator n=1 Tax=Burkholderia pyrrocinia TaxID=60550 RepID=A0A2Z5N528_BURPY|nr:MerR family transcriptional regulator [Burkholderia pyrrocinia]AXF24665.1 MerR family transcriptional regulator [Burkholderia pyrrocinia]
MTNRSRRVGADDASEQSLTLLIGEIAQATGRSIHAIRWYESQGLLPGVQRDAAGRRRYSRHHVGWLDLMDRLRCTGMSIAQLRAYTALVKQGPPSLRERRALLAAHRARVQDNIRRWTDALELIDAKVEFYDEWVASGARPAVSPHQRIRATRGGAPAEWRHGPPAAGAANKQENTDEPDDP